MAGNRDVDSYSSEESGSLISRIIATPSNQKQRIQAATLGLVSLASSAGIFLMDRLTAPAIIGVPVALALGLASWWVARKHPGQRSSSVVLGSVAGLTFLNATIASGLAGFVFTTAGLATLALGIWKIGSAIYSIFKKK